MSVESKYWIDGLCFMIFTLCGVVMLKQFLAIAAIDFVMAGMYLQAHLDRLLELPE